MNAASQHDMDDNRTRKRKINHNDEESDSSINESEEEKESQLSQKKRPVVTNVGNSSRVQQRALGEHSSDSSDMVDSGEEENQGFGGRSNNSNLTIEEKRKLQEVHLKNRLSDAL